MSQATVDDQVCPCPQCLAVPKLRLWREPQSISLDPTTGRRVQYGSQYTPQHRYAHPARGILRGIPERASRRAEVPPHLFRDAQPNPLQQRPRRPPHLFRDEPPPVPRAPPARARPVRAPPTPATALPHPPAPTPSSASASQHPPRSLTPALAPQRHRRPGMPPHLFGDMLAGTPVPSRRPPPPSPSRSGNYQMDGDRPTRSARTTSNLFRDRPHPYAPTQHRPAPQARASSQQSQTATIGSAYSAPASLPGAATAFPGMDPAMVPVPMPMYPAFTSMSGFLAAAIPPFLPQFQQATPSSATPQLAAWMPYPYPQQTIPAGNFSASGTPGPWPPPSDGTPQNNPIMLCRRLTPNPSHPTLPHVVWDIAQHPVRARWVTGRHTIVPLSTYFGEVATSPEATQIHIECDIALVSVRWGPIVIDQSRAITVGDVLYAIYEYFQVQMSRDDVDLVARLRPGSRERMYKAFGRRCRASAALDGYEYRQGMRRVDCLGDETAWWGAWVTIRPDNRWHLNLGVQSITDNPRLRGQAL